MIKLIVSLFLGVVLVGCTKSNDTTKRAVDADQIINVEKLISFTLEIFCLKKVSRI